MSGRIVYIECEEKMNIARKLTLNSYTYFFSLERTQLHSDTRVYSACTLTQEYTAPAL
jgi:hypothetical protein